MICGENILKDVAYLTRKIGVRLAGSHQEKAAAEYLQQRFLEYVPECEIETFPAVCSNVDVSLHMLAGDAWVSIPALRFNLTPVESLLEAPIVLWNKHTDYQRHDLSCLTGKAVLHWGLVGCESDYRRLVEAKPAFLMFVDTRLPNDRPIANSLIPAWVKRYGAVPSVSIPYLSAWELMRKSASHARLQMKGSTYSAASYNVVATLPGTDKDAGIVYLGGHMDSVVGSVGADDNALGCAIIVELARVLAKTSHKHTLRFIAFGAEEQLSVGSAMYLRQHREEVQTKGVFMCNFDSCGSLLGWNAFSVNATDTLVAQMQQILNSEDIYYLANRVPDPYNDLFPFTVVGIPGITFMRRNCESGNFYHHQPQNSLENISVSVVEQLAGGAAKLITRIIEENSDNWGTDPTTHSQVLALWEAEYGGW